MVLDKYLYIDRILIEVYQRLSLIEYKNLLYFINSSNNLHHLQNLLSF